MYWYVQMRYTVFMGHYQLQVSRNYTAVMQAANHFLKRGHCHFVQGKVPSDKVAGLTDKLADRYVSLLAGDRERTSARKLGVPLVNLFWRPVLTLGAWEFLLLADQPLAGERMQDAKRRSQRIVVGDGLYRSVRKADGGWTWELAEEQVEQWRSSLTRNARSGNNLVLQQGLDRLLRVSMFSGVRRQVFGLLQEARRVHRKFWPDGGWGPAMEWPKSLPKMRFMRWYHDPPLSIAAALDWERDEAARRLEEARLAGPA